MRPAAFCLPHKYCKYEKGRAQHFSRQPERLGRLLAATRLGPRGRSASQGIRTNAHGGAVKEARISRIKERRLGQPSRRGVGIYRLVRQLRVLLSPDMTAGKPSLL